MWRLSKRTPILNLNIVLRTQKIYNVNIVISRWRYLCSAESFSSLSETKSPSDWRYPRAAHRDQNNAPIRADGNQLVDSFRFVMFPHSSDLSREFWRSSRNFSQTDEGREDERKDSGIKRLPCVSIWSLCCRLETKGWVSSSQRGWNGRVPPLITRSFAHVTSVAVGSNESVDRTSRGGENQQQDASIHSYFL